MSNSATNLATAGVKARIAAAVVSCHASAVGGRQGVGEVAVPGEDPPRQFQLPIGWKRDVALHRLDCHRR
jgi:hypothetical protein